MIQMMTQSQPDHMRPFYLSLFHVEANVAGFSVLSLC